MVTYRLIKSEPYKYSRDDFQRDGKTIRDGVRNFQARNNLKAMQKGDLCLRYHSNKGKEIIGIAEVTKEAYQDPTTDDPNWVVVEIVPYKKLEKTITLDQIKKNPTLQSMILIRQQRLSVCPVSVGEFMIISQQ